GGQGGEFAGGSPSLEPSETDWEVSFSLLPVLYMLVFVLGLSGNGLVIFTVWRGPAGKRRSADTYIGNLALADLAFVVTLPLWAAYTALRFHWPFGSLLCKLSSYLVLLNMFASAFCLGCLSFERYLAIVHALPRSAGRPPSSGARGRCDMDFSSVASSDHEKGYWMAALSLATTALGFVLPLALMTLCYCCIGATVNRHFAQLARKEEGKQRRRLLRIIVTLVAVFAACWLPFHLLKSLYVLYWVGLIQLPCAWLELIPRLHPYATCLAYINSCLNPFLYAFFDGRFRAQCLQLLGWRKARRGPGGSVSSTLSGQTQKSELPSLGTKV
uniref:G-protein coupled receptors family 1 profile domain-containing protein n=1 Tax=Salvator merianae TaxID=96440 RepID=A0A8D0DYH2_SALMN